MNNNIIKYFIIIVIIICVLLLGIVIGISSNSFWPSENQKGKEVKSASFTVLFTNNSMSSSTTSDSINESEELFKKITAILNEDVYNDVSKEINGVEPVLISKVNNSSVTKITYICNNLNDSECLRISERYCDLLSHYIKTNFDMNEYSFGIIDTPYLDKTVLVGN